MIENTQKRAFIDSTSCPPKAKRARAEENKVAHTAKNVLDLELLVRDYVGIHILKYLAPNELTQLGFVSKYFHSVIHQEHHDQGRTIKIELARNGYSSYLLTLYLQGEGFINFLDNYLTLLESSENGEKKEFLKDVLLSKLIEITEKIRSNKNACSIDVAKRILVQLFERIASKPIRTFLDYILTLPEYFVSVFPYYMDLLERMTELLSKSDMNIQSREIQCHLAKVIEHLTRNFAETGDLEMGKQIYEILMNPTVLSGTDRYIHNRIALFVFYLVSMKNDLELKKTLEIPSRLFHQPLFQSSYFFILMTYLFCLIREYKDQIDFDAYVKKNLPKSGYFFPFLSIFIKQMIEKGLDFSKLKERLESSKGLRVTFKRLQESDFKEVLKIARASSSEEAFDYLLDLRYPSDDILMNEKLNPKRVYSVILDYGRYAKDGWSVLQLDPSYCTREVLRSICDSYQFFKGYTHSLMDFLLVVFTEHYRSLFDNSWIYLYTGPLFNPLDEEKKDQLLTILFSQKIDYIEKCRILVYNLYPNNYPLDSMLQLVSGLTSFQKTNLLNRFIEVHKIVEKHKLFEFIKHFDQIVDHSKRDIIYGKLIDKYTKPSCSYYLSSAQISTLKRSLFFVLVPKLSFEKRLDYCDYFRSAGVINEKELLDMQI